MIANQRVWFVRDGRINRGVVIDWGKLDGEDVIFVKGRKGWTDRIWVVKEGEHNKVVEGGV